MVESEQEKSRASEQVGYYVYCIVETEPAEKLVAGDPPVTIEEGARLELVNYDQLTAVTSIVPLTSYGEEQLTSNLTDATWTAIRAMRHEQVVEYFAKRTSTIPLRFATIYVDREGVETMLGQRSSQLQEILRRLEGKEEWGVNVFSDRAKLLENITNISPRLKEMGDAIRQATPGQAYLMQKKIEALKTDEVKVEITRLVNEIESRLIEKSEGATRLRILKVETTEHGELRAKFAFLVEKAKFGEFHDAAEAIAREMSDAGIRLELTGPWPAYNFSGESSS
jgi:hypothetical protein